MAKTPQEILAEAENPTHTRVESVYILQRQDLAVELEQAQAEQRAVARRSGDVLGSKELSEINARIEALEAEIDEALIEFKFKALDYQTLTGLSRAHPPTPEQKKQGLAYNPDTYDLALLADCCVHPEGADVEFFKRLSAAYSPVQFQMLLMACNKVNLQGGSLPKAIAAKLGLTPRSNGRSETSVSETDEESLPASS